MWQCFSRVKQSWQFHNLSVTKMKLFSYLFTQRIMHACLWRLWINYDVKMSLNTWLFTFVNKFILFLYKVHKLLMILCILAVVHVTVHDTCTVHVCDTWADISLERVLQCWFYFLFLHTHFCISIMSSHWEQK